MESDTLLLALVLIGGLFFCNVSLFYLIRHSNGLGLLDKPNQRKTHSGHVPLIGGLSIYIATSIAGLFIFGFTVESLAVFVSFTLMVATGVLDDRFDLSVRLRILIQVAAAAILVSGANIHIASLGNVFGFGEIKLGVLSGPFTILAIMAAMNAYNMIDGIDGLLGSLATVTFLGISALAWLTGNNLVFVCALLMTAALIPFLVCNLQLLNATKIFMGDAGSMFIGLVIIWLMALLLTPELQADYQLRLNILSFDGMTVRPVAMLWLITIPLMDMLGIMTRRILKKQNPFKPDRDHLHHIFMRAGFTACEALLIITASAIFWMCVGIVLEYLKVPEPIVLAIYLGVFGVYLYCLTYAWKVVSVVRKVRGI